MTKDSISDKGTSGAVLRQNRLLSEKSPYLLQHAHNPVDWYPWGEEAFAAAEKEDKPVFLSVGYSTCHWCHVMAHESFEDPDVAASDEPGIRLHKSGPRGEAGHRPDVHERSCYGHDRQRRLASYHHHDCREEAVLRRHLHPQDTAASARRE